MSYVRDDRWGRRCRQDPGRPPHPGKAVTTLVAKDAPDGASDEVRPIFHSEIRTRSGHCHRLVILDTKDNPEERLIFILPPDHVDLLVLEFLPCRHHQEGPADTQPLMTSGQPFTDLCWQQCQNGLQRTFTVTIMRFVQLWIQARAKLN